jgi:hypothetical protein
MDAAGDGDDAGDDVGAVNGLRPDGRCDKITGGSRGRQRTWFTVSPC